MRLRLLSSFCLFNGSKSYCNFFISFLISLIVCLHLRSNHFNVNKECDYFDRSEQLEDKLDQSYESLVPLINRLKNTNRRHKLFIGVMTAQKFIDDRIAHIIRTWGHDAIEFLAFFSSSSSKFNHGLPIINLPTVDDSYPPQKKSFLMLKFIHDHFIDHYEWFMRADDDIFINVPKLIDWLGKINSSRPQLIGQMGLGKTEEFGQLGLGDDDNFCMGGPGIIMSRETLKAMIPHVQYCLKHLYSTHEDVEISRCAGKFVGISCTRSYQMQSLFYHNFSGEVVWSSRLKKVFKNAITLHPIKNSLTLYDIYHHMMETRHETIRNEISRIHRSIKRVQNSYGDVIEREFNLPLDPLINGNSSLIGTPVLLPTKDGACFDRSHLIPWDFIDNRQYSPKYLNPKRRFEGPLIPALESNLIDILHSVNKLSHLRGRMIDFKSLYYGYTKVDPLRGVYYILDLMMTYRRYKGRKLTLPVRKHAYIVQTFSNPVFRVIDTHSNLHVFVNLIVPLSGRFKQFQRFIRDFIEVYRSDPYINLAVILFPDIAEAQNESIQTKEIIKNLMKQGYPVRFAELGGYFSRAAGLQRGASLFKPNDLLFFVDVDITFNAKVLQRVRLNTIQGSQVYYPIVFSQYSSLLADNLSQESTVTIDSEHGYWRQFGFGIVSIYNSDLIAVNGLNLAIQGWGKEDVDLYDRIVASNLTVFRSPDKNLIHIYHQTHCNTALHPSQYEMCLGSKLSNLASISQMARFIELNKII